MTWVDFVSRDVWSFQSDKLGEDDLIYVYLHIYIYVCMYVWVAQLLKKMAGNWNGASQPQQR